jgi:DNA-binding transcriptional regulator YiaG
MTPDDLRAFRDTHDLTRAQMATLLGVAPGTVRNWEQGVRNMPAPTDLALRRVTRAMIDRVKRTQPPKRRARRPSASGPSEGEGT